MSNSEDQYTRLGQAQKRVKEIKGFYQHLTVYIVINVVLLLFSKSIKFVLLSEEALGNPEFLEWINWNIWGTPIIWGIAVLIHAASVFLKSPFKEWEKREIEKILKEDREKANTFGNETK